MSPAEKAFYAADYSRGGLISRSEFNRWIKTLRLNAYALTAAKSYAYRVYFRRSNTQISKAKFMNLWARIMLIKRSRSTAEARAFAICDSTRGKMIDHKEFDRCATRFGLNKFQVKFIRRYAKLFFKRYGRVYSGRKSLGLQITRARFYVLYRYMMTVGKKIKMSAQQKAFHMCDSSNGGLVSTTEFNRCVTRFGLNSMALRLTRAWAYRYYFRSRYSQITMIKFYALYNRMMYYKRTAKSPQEKAAIRCGSRGYITKAQFAKCVTKFGMDSYALRIVRAHAYRYYFHKRA
jgi:Ca2+-binding EF-hand superfamily protein